MKDYKDTKRTYYVDINDIVIGITHQDGSVVGEFSIEWYNQNPFLHAFDDSWEILYYHFQDLLKEMANVDDKDIDKEEFIKILEKLNIVNQKK